VLSVISVVVVVKIMRCMLLFDVIYDLVSLIINFWKIIS